MSEVTYTLGSVNAIQPLFPPAELANSDVGLTNIEDVIAHYTKNSLDADGFYGSTVKVNQIDGTYQVTITGSLPKKLLKQFARGHREFFSNKRAQKAITGRKLLEKMRVWNPMAGFHVNRNPSDGKCKWQLFPPLGLNVINQSSVVLMHYPPWQVLQQATFLEVMTMHRWSTVLLASGVPPEELSFYRTFVDINPIAAPGSGQSEYPNDYFPIMMASAFFDAPGKKSYIRSMLEFYLNGDKAKGDKYTLPLLICGSPLYDPQAPGWFRAAYKDILPLNKDGIAQVDVLQTGTFKLHHDSERETPYMIANHMIAAGVTGKCTDSPGKIPDIRKYEAQDLVAASFLHAYAENPDISPNEAKRQACEKWFGNNEGSGAPKPPHDADAQTICALAQMDLHFEHGPPPHPKYTFEEAKKRCARMGNQPC